MSTQPKHYIPPEEYLQRERKAEYKSEYHGGEVFAMAGAGRNHVRISVNMVRLLDAALGPGCEVMNGDMRVRVAATGLYTYPDASVVCGDAQFADEDVDVLLNPALLVEVLSPSTEAYDRGLKFQSYRTIASLKTYVLIAADRVGVDVFTFDDGRWTLDSTSDPGGTLQLRAFNASLAVRDIYARTGLVPEPGATI